jgi:transcriptional regulator with XRE-family HTH domain
MKDTLLVENRIWKYRNINGFKQEELAFLIGQDAPSQVSRYERGLVIPKLEQLIKLCYAMDTKIESIYPQLMKKWHQEVENKKERLRKL